jgi:thiamine-phosphate pyrophosphorylase
MVQLREKDLPTRELLRLAMALRDVIGDRADLLVNGRADVAFAAGAAGVHLPSDGLPIEGARAAIGRAALLGRSVHSIDEARAAWAEEDLDYVELGTIFPSRSHPGGPVLGLEAVGEAAALGLPVLAIGGIDARNAASVLVAGASGVAVISAILAADDPGVAAEQLCRAVRDGWDAREGANPARPGELPCE